jgi:hypothetical protein
MPYGCRSQLIVRGHWRGPVTGRLVSFVREQAVRSFSSVRGHGTRVLGIMVAVSLLPGLLWGPATAAEPETPSASETTIPRQPEYQKPTAEELENWRQAILKIPQPRNGCFTANYPEEHWREVACKKPSDKLYLPKTLVEQVGNGPDFTATVTGQLSQAEGSFDPGTVVSSECDVPCPKGVCPTNPTCTSASANNYSLQLNTKPFKTNTCAGSPGGINGGCLGWQQFVYSSTGGGVIQYWLETYGPAGTSCPAPSGANCKPGKVSTDGWCPFSFSPTGPVYCVVNAAASAQAPAEPITSLSELKLKGAVAGVSAPNDYIAVTTSGGAVNTASGNNYFPDLGSQWQEAEFNVFGDGNGDQAVFNAGTTVVVRTQVDSGTTSAPGCGGQSFTGESNNLTLVGTPAVVPTSPLPAIVFTESNAAGGTPPTCATSGGGLNCLEVSSSGRRDCTDAGGAASTCASATCPGGLTLTGGGGACAAGNSKIKSLFPIERQGSFTIVCEKQGVDPQAVAICCHI